MSIQAASSNAEQYLVWEQKVVVDQSGSHDLTLLGSYFNAYKSIYLLAYSKSKKKLYVALYNIASNSFSKFKYLCDIDEELYTAALFEETPMFSRWYILGERNLWMLSLGKGAGEFNNDELVTFANENFPLRAESKEKVFKGASLIVFDKIAWIIGGSICKDRKGKEIDTRRRIILSERRGADPTKKTGKVWRGYESFKYLVHPRTAPMLFRHNKELFCLGGNDEFSKDSFCETLALRPYHWPTRDTAHVEPYIFHYTTERSILNSINCQIPTINPRPAYCSFNNDIFIFSKQLYSPAKLYLKFSYVNNFNNWEFLSTGGIDANSLKFTSARAEKVGRSMYLILFNAGSSENYLGEDESSGKTKLSVFEIKEAK